MIRNSNFLHQLPPVFYLLKFTSSDTFNVYSLEERTIFVTCSSCELSGNDIYLYILTLSAFCVECQIFHSNTMSHFFNIEIFRVLRIFNGILQTKSVETLWWIVRFGTICTIILPEQLQDEKNNRFAEKNHEKVIIVLKRFPEYKLK